MHKSMRWGVSSMLVLGALAASAFVGCGDDPAPTPPVDTDTGDTGTKDTATGDTGTPGDAPADADAPCVDAPPTPPAADRSVTVVHASPDLGAKFLCLGAFGADPAAADKPLQALGPIGKPDTTAPLLCDGSFDPKKFTGLPYGAAANIPLSPTAITALGTFTVALWLVDTNPLTATPASTCSDTWKDVKGDASKWLKVDKGTIKAGESYILAMKGCKNASTATTPECGASGAAASFNFSLLKLDPAKPTAFAGGTTGPKTGIQFVHLSKFEGVSGAVPSFQNIDVYLQAMGTVTGSDAGTDGGDAATDAATDAGSTVVPVGTPIAIAGDKAGTAGVKYDDVAAKAVGVQLPGTPSEALLILSVHGTTPCIGGPSTTCPTSVTIPLKLFLAGYKPTGGGFNDGQNQFIALFGSPTGGASSTLRAAFGRSDF